MINLEQYEFPTGEFMYIIEPTNENGLAHKEEIVVYYENTDGTRKILPHKQGLIVYKLAKNSDIELTPTELYKYYSGDDENVPTTANDLLSSMVALINKNSSEKQTFIKRKKIFNGSGGNYYLCGKKIKGKEIREKDNVALPYVNENANWERHDIIGSYIGFYLDHGGDGAVKGMYLRIEEDESNVLRAYAIHNLANLDFLKNEGISMREMYASLDKRIHGASKLFSGVVKGYENLVYIELAHELVPQKINVVWDLRSYLVFKKHEHVKRPYRGGLGLQFVLCDIQSNEATYASRIGFIREDRMNGISLPIDDESIKKRLSVSPHRTAYGPLKIDEDDDRSWYHWFTYR